MMTEKELYGQLKHRLPIDRAPKYLKWLKEKYPYFEPHHILGSTSRRLKLTDYLIVMVSRKDHDYAERYKIPFAIENLYKAIINLIEYTKHLENK
jgi:hypothetical protein